MMEQTQVSMRKDNSMFISSLDTFCIHNASRGRSEVLNPTPPSTVHIIREREERVARARDAVQLLRVHLALLRAQRRGHLLEVGLPLRELAALERLAGDEEVDRVRLLRALDALLEREREHARVVPQPPEVRLGAREARAVDARLLPGADPDRRAAVGVRDAVRLRVLERERGDDEVGDRLVVQLCGVAS